MHRLNVFVWVVALGFGVAACFSAESPPAAAGEKAPAATAEGTTVLDLERGSFRAFMSWRTPTLVAADGKLLPLREPKRTDVKDEDRKPIPVRESACPAKNWASPGFDDSEWCRMRGPAVVQQSSAEWRLVCVRGKFIVTDPAQVQQLELNVSYYGGVRVFVNDAELVREHLPAGEIKSDTFGERYPDEAYVRPDGKLYGPKDSQDKAMAERMKVRVRKLTFRRGSAEGVVVPRNLLRKGINVIAIESRAAPIGELAFDAPLPDASGGRDVWPHAGIVVARMECASPNALIPNVGPAAGIQIGNVSPAETLTVLDYAHPADALQPVRLAGAANGVFSGRVVLSSADTIRGLKAAATELVQVGGQARIPASAVWIRWADAATPDKSWGLGSRFDRLLSDPPSEVVPAKAARSGAVSVAVAPIWITVRVPADAAAGEYKGYVTIEAQGTAAVKFTVPVEIKIHAWKVPDPRDFTSINNIYHSPDSVAQYYKVPLWSDKHFDLIGKSFDVLHQVGTRICTLNLVVGAHGHGNSESMVRWIKKDDPSAGSGQAAYDYDFSVAEKYMDVYAKTCGKPLILRVNAWAFQGDNPEHPKWPPEGVTVVDKDGKRLENMGQPPYGTPENEAFWRPVFVELRKRLEKRGWFDVTYIGWLDYCRAPNKGIVDVARKIWPDGRWITSAHAPSKNFGGMPVKYAEWVWGCGALCDPDCEAPWGRRLVYSVAGRLAYPRPWALSEDNINLGIPRWGTGFVRPGLYGHASLMRYRVMAEATLQGNLRGLGMVGGDFWPLPLGARGRLGTICGGQGGVTPVNNTLAMCSPGPDGAIFNERLEMFREGIQIAEAMIFLQKAVAAKRVGGDQARRIEVLLDERARCHLRNRNPLLVGPNSDPGYWLTRECTDWRASDAELFALAGEVALSEGGKR